MITLALNKDEVVSVLDKELANVKDKLRANELSLDNISYANYVLNGRYELRIELIPVVKPFISSVVAKGFRDSDAANDNRAKQ